MRIKIGVFSVIRLASAALGASPSQTETPSAMPSFLVSSSALAIDTVFSLGAMLGATIGGVAIGVFAGLAVGGAARHTADGPAS